nr:head maturation protease, ClpP-related [Clavibacter michiganensis]
MAKSTTGGTAAKNERRANRYWGEKPVPKSKTEFFNAITTPAPAGDGTIATIRMYGPIDSWGGWWGISAADVGETLDALPAEVDQIILRINSPGGEVFEAVSILNMLRAHKATVLAVVDGLAASAASVITAGCDEAVMSPGTQMMIHKPWSFAWGSSEDMRKEAGVLDSIEASLIEIYSGKAGEADWPQLLAAETWLTGPEAVELGLADRVAVIPDAGGSSTVGDLEPEIIVPIETEDVENALARVATIAAATRSAAPRLPSSSEPGDHNQKENVVAYDDLKAGLRERLGVTDADASDEQLLAAVDATAAKAGTTTAPEGTTLIDAGVLAELQASAADGRAARAQQASERRDGIVAKALSEGRIAPATQATWRAQLETNEEGTASLLNSLPKNTIPVEEIGHSDDIPDPEARLEAAAGWTDKKTEA